MYTWLFRVVIILTCPAIVYFGKISHNAAGVGIGLGVGALMVLIECLVAELNLLSLFMGILGAATGIILAKLVDYLVLQVGDNSLYSIWDASRPALLRIRRSGRRHHHPQVSRADDLDKDILKMGKKRAPRSRFSTPTSFHRRPRGGGGGHALPLGNSGGAALVLTELHRLADAEDPSSAPAAAAGWTCWPVCRRTFHSGQNSG